MSQPLKGRPRLAAAVPGNSAEARGQAELAEAIRRCERAIPLERTVVGSFDGRGAGLAPTLTTGRNQALRARWDAVGSITIVLASAGLWIDVWANVVGSSGRRATTRAFDSSARTVSILVWSLVGAAADLLVGDRLIVSALELRSLE